MSVAFGFPAGARVATPEGDVPLGSIAVGATVWAADTEGRRAPARVAEVRRWTVDHLVAVRTASGGLSGCAPGTNVWDAFEEAWRAAGSLSTLSEVLVDRGDGALVAEQVIETPERLAEGMEVAHLTLERPHAALLVDGVLVRHKEGA